MVKNDKEVIVKGFVADLETPDDNISGSGAVESMLRNLKLIKIWHWLKTSDPEAASTLANQANIEKALDVMHDDESSEQELKTKVFKALEIKESVATQVEQKSLRDVMSGVSDDKIQVEHAGKTKNVEEWLTELRGEPNPNHELLLKLEQKMQTIFEGVGVKELRGIDDGRALGEIEDALAILKQREEIRESSVQRRVTGKKTAIGRLYEKEIKNTGRESLWQLRQTKASDKKRLESLIAITREEAIDSFTEDQLAKLSGKEVVSRLDHVNDLRANITVMLDNNIKTEDAKTLKNILINLQLQYEELLSQKIVESWRESNRSDDWNINVARSGLRKYLDSNRKGWSPRINWDSEKVDERLGQLVKGVNKESIKIVEKNKKKGKSQIEVKTGTDVGGPTPDQFESMKKFKQTEQELDKILGTDGYLNMTYNLFEDVDFWNDLANGDKGMDAIVKRAKPKNEAEFRNILKKIRTDKESGGINLEKILRPKYGLNAEDGDLSHENFGRQLDDLIKQKRYGAAANLMLEYSTRVGIRESGQDLEFMMIRRNFLNKLSKISPDFAAQFEMNQMLGYLPSLSSQKIEEFLSSYQRLHSKGNLDIIEGDNALMGGNQIEFDGKKITFSVKTFEAMLRNPRHIIKVLKAAPNTLDSTLQGIVLEEMYGRGAKLELVEKNGERGLFLALPGQTKDKWRSLKDIKVNMHFANLDAAGFNGWSDKDIEKGISLEEALNRNQWMFRDGMSMMWYSEEWKQVVAAKSYQTALMAAAPKALLTSDVAKAAYQGQFENIAAPMMEVAEVVSGSMLGGMSIYKAKDMVSKNVARQLWKELGSETMSGEEAKKKQERFSKIGDIFLNMHVRNRTVDINGEKVTFKNRLRMNDMARLAFNDLSEDSGEVLGLLRRRFEDMGMGGVPTDDELRLCYKRWKEAGGFGHIPSPAENDSIKDKMKMAYFGQEYDALWQEVKELKFDEYRSDWDNLTMEELNVLWKMNDKMFGKPVDRNLVIEPGESEPQALKSAKKQFLSEIYIGSFVDRTATSNGDDHDQYAIKYAPAKYEALKILYKFLAVRGTVADFDAFTDQLMLFMEKQERWDTIAYLGNRYNTATSNNRVAPLLIPLTTSRKHQREHPWWKPGKQDHAMRGVGEIEWIKYTDVNNNTYFATTVNGDRAYETEEYGGKGLLDSGNWSKNELGIDFVRSSDFELIAANLGTKMVLDKHSVHLMVERMLGTNKEVEHVFGGFLKKTGMSHENQHKFIHMISSLTTKGKLLALKIFFFNDPKYAMWTLAHEAFGFTGKAFEQIFGLSVGGGGKGHH